MVKHVCTEKDIRIPLFFFFTETPPDIATDTKTDEKMPYSTSKLLNVSPTKLQFSFCVSYQTVCGVGSK